MKSRAERHTPVISWRMATVVSIEMARCRALRDPSISCFVYSFYSSVGLRLCRQSARGLVYFVSRCVVYFACARLESSGLFAMLRMTLDFGLAANLHKLSANHALRSSSATLPPYVILRERQRAKYLLAGVVMAVAGDAWMPGVERSFARLRMTVWGRWLLS